MKSYITKSKAGHYVVTVFDGAKRIYRSDKLSNIHSARADLAKFKAGHQAAQ